MQTRRRQVELCGGPSPSARCRAVFHITGMLQRPRLGVFGGGGWSGMPRGDRSSPRLISSTRSRTGLNPTMVIDPPGSPNYKASTCEACAASAVAGAMPFAVAEPCRRSSATFAEGSAHRDGSAEPPKPARERQAQAGHPIFSVDRASRSVHSGRLPQARSASHTRGRCSHRLVEDHRGAERRSSSRRAQIFHNGDLGGWTRGDSQHTLKRNDQRQMLRYGLGG